MTTEVAYHSDGYGPARPAVNVKVGVPGPAFWPAAFDALPVADGRNRKLVDDKIDRGRAEVTPLAFFTRVDALRVKHADPLAPAVEGEAAVKQ